MGGTPFLLLTPPYPTRGVPPCQRSRALSQGPFSASRVDEDLGHSDAVLPTTGESEDLVGRHPDRPPATQRLDQAGSARGTLRRLPQGHDVTSQPELDLR